jgi:hypothetical protein
VLVRGCKFEWETESESPDGCPRCGEWRTVEIGRCYECPLTALDEEMDSSRGRLIGRAFHKLNLMKAGVRYGPDDLTAEEAYVIEMIELEKPVAGLSMEANRGA